jgi:hypothetical protein
MNELRSNLVYFLTYTVYKKKYSDGEKGELEILTDINILITPQYEAVFFCMRLSVCTHGHAPC